MASTRTTKWYWARPTNIERGGKANDRTTRDKQNLQATHGRVGSGSERHLPSYRAWRVRGDCRGIGLRKIDSDEHPRTVRSANGRPLLVGWTRCNDPQS